MSGTKDRSSVDRLTGFWESIAPLAILLGGVVAGFAVAKRKAGKALSLWTPFLVKVDPGAAELVLVDREGNTIQDLGVVISCPQTCAILRPGGTHRNDQTNGRRIFPTLEWMREITFVPLNPDGSTPDIDGAIDSLGGEGSPRVVEDNKAIGCGYVSMNVAVTQLTNPNGQWQEDIYSSAGGADYFYAIAAAGEKKPDGYYYATEIWISEDVWDLNSDTISDIYDNLPVATGSPCG